MSKSLENKKSRLKQILIYRIKRISESLSCVEYQRADDEIDILIDEILKVK